MKNFIVAAMLALLAGVMDVQVIWGVESPYLQCAGSAWRLAVGDVTGDGKIELIFGTYQGAVGCMDPRTGETLWKLETGSFPFRVRSADVNRDGKAEVFAVTADGALLAISSDGVIQWTFRSKYALYDLDTGDVEKGGDAEIVCGGIDRRVYVLSAQGELIAKSEQVAHLVHRLAVGDLDADGTDEILVLDSRTEAIMMKLAGGRLEAGWKKTMKVPDKFINWENPRGNFFAFSLAIGNLDGSGTPEIIAGDTYFNRQAVMSMNAEAEPLWLSEKESGQVGDNTISEFYSTAFVAAGEIDPRHPGQEIVAVKGGVVELYSKDGESLGRASSRLGFTDVAVDGQMVYLGSTPNGDNTIYRIDFGGDWRGTVNSLERQGAAREFGENLRQLRERVLSYSGGAAYSGRKYNIRFGGISPNEKGYKNYRESIEWFKQEFPYENLVRVVNMHVIEETPPLDENGKPWSESRWQVDAINGTMTTEEIMTAARWIEEHKVPTLFTIGHSCMPFITLETAEKILQAAPEYCIGFLSAEDEQLDRIPRYFKYYFGPLADLCVRYGSRQCITLNKNVWYMSVPSIANVFDELFGGERRKVFLPATEDSNSRTPEINLLARGGLWLAGLIDGYQVSVISDLFSFCRFHQWEYPKSGHPYLRLLLAHTLLGGTDFLSRITDLRKAGDSYEFTVIGRESTEIFYHMLGKGLAFTPRREDVLGFSPVGIAVHEPREKWLADGHNGHQPEIWTDDPEMDNAVIPHNGCLWGNTSTPEHALQRVLLHKDRQFGYQMPATPYGLVALVPAPADLKNVPHIDEWWHTDGISIWREGGPKLTGSEAGHALRNSFENAAKRLPFRISGDDVFMQAVRMNDTTIRLFIIDPGWLDPQERHVSVRIQSEGDFRVRDVLTRERIPVRNRSMNVTIPAGAFGIFDVQSVLHD